MDAEESRLFADSLRQAITRHGDNDVDAALTEVDWRGALADDPPSATRVVFSLLGELNVVASAIDDVLLQALGLDTPTRRAVVLPALGLQTPPASYDRAELTISGVAGRRIADAAEAVVVIDGGKKDFLATVDTATLALRPIAGMDPNGGWHEVAGQVKIGQFQAVDWISARATGQLAIAQQLTSASRAMLTLAREHAVTRNQFGRPIGSFQAVRHKLAEAYVAVEAADAAAEAGWADPSPFTAAMAKLVAGTTAKTVAKHAQQVLAGMGFTSEHPFHRYLKRTLVLDQLLGSSANLRRELGRSILESNEIPQLLPL